MTDNNRLAAFAAAVGADVSNTGFQYARCYENQRHYPFAGWTDKLLPTDREQWSDETGTLRLDRDSLHPPPKCKWCGSWEVVVQPSETDNEGWQYATGNFMGPYKNKNFTLSLCRRRQWRRPFRLVTTAEQDQILASGIVDEARQIATGAAAAAAASIADGIVRREWSMVADAQQSSPITVNGAPAPAPATVSTPVSSQPPPLAASKQAAAGGGQQQQKDGAFDSIASIFGFGSGGRKLPTDDPDNKTAHATRSGGGQQQQADLRLAGAPLRPGTHNATAAPPPPPPRQPEPEKFDAAFGNPNAIPLEPGKPTMRTDMPDPFANAFGSSGNNPSGDNKAAEFMSARERAAAAGAVGRSSNNQTNNININTAPKQDSLFGDPNQPLFPSSGSSSAAASPYTSGPTIGSSVAAQQRATTQQPSLFGAVDNAPIFGASHTYTSTRTAASGSSGAAAGVGGSAIGTTSNTFGGGGDPLFGTPAPVTVASSSSYQQPATFGGGGGDSLFASTTTSLSSTGRREDAARADVDDLLSKFM